jgi:hypothetical protein
VRVQFVHLEELLNSRCGHDVRSDHSRLELGPHFRVLVLVVLLDASTGKIGNVPRMKARLAPTLHIITIFPEDGRRPLLSPKRETDAAG